jgi:hypothetical protein
VEEDRVTPVRSTVAAHLTVSMVSAVFEIA